MVLVVARDYLHCGEPAVHGLVDQGHHGGELRAESMELRANPRNDSLGTSHCQDV